MFESFYGLRADPFRLTPDHQFSFEHEHFSKAKAYIDYALVRGEGFVMVTGMPGTGKTTLVADLQARLPVAEITTATINCTQLDAEALLLISAYEFGLQVESTAKAVLLRELMAFFHREHHSGRRVLLIIDEAQDLSVQALEELRLLTNLQSAGRPLLQIILLGQSSLLDLIRRPEMLQVHQRIVAATHLQALTPRETIEYVRHRLLKAGWTGRPTFRPGVLKSVYSYSLGVPRLINQICSRMLLRGFSLELVEITRHDAYQVLQELQEEGLVQAPRSSHEQSPQSLALHWSEIDHGLYPEKPSTHSVNQILSDKPLNQAPPQPAADLQAQADEQRPNTAHAITANPYSEPPIPAQEDPEYPATESAQSTPDALEEVSTDKKPITPITAETPVTVNQGTSHPEDQPTIIRPFSVGKLVIAFLALSLVLISFLAGMLLSNPQPRAELMEVISRYASSAMDFLQSAFQ
ncbi:putative secretion ATPase, PEP-CTERM locus subfamily [Thiorhodovibrio winogradskyi]|uniref:Secretion ATPase, PEP-CTERM locus subfamily n=1 Tax=Thiorhodovibrio winogradskyi TaxID=77007 RepID=A0ABZ0SBB1_9GAMM|nr:AAA family ATPase [Thiorhodovibrio winogradskyi]